MDAKGSAAWLAIGISLLWNAINTYRSVREEKRSHRVTEFKELKAPVDGELRELRRIKNKISSFALTAQTDDDFIESAGKLNRHLSKKILDLDVALETLDKSNHSDGTEWTEKVHSESDKLFEEFDRLYATNELADRKEKISEIVKKLDALIAELQKLLETELDLKAAGPSWHLDLPVLKIVSEIAEDRKKWCLSAVVQMYEIGREILFRQLADVGQRIKRFIEDKYR